MIKHYKLKDGIDAEFLLKNGCKEGGSYVQEDAKYVIFRPLHGSITVDIAFPEDLSKWNDDDYILVIDEDFGQPYGPFYKFYAQKRIEGYSPFLTKVMKKYNEVMDSLPFFEERKMTLKDFLD